MIGADNITLDLNGHTIDGDGTLVDPCPERETCDFGVDNTADHSGVTIEGGSVKEFALGLIVLGTSDNRLRHLSVSSNFFVGIVIGESAHTRVERSSITRNGLTTDEAGMVLFASHDNLIQRNRLSGNGDIGLFAVEAVDDNRIFKNTFSDNPEAAMILEGGDRNEVSRNRVVRNGDGIIVSGDDNAVVHNLIADAVGCEDGCGAGIAAEGGTGNVLVGNRIARTRREGIRLNSYDPEAPMTGTVIRRNLVRDAGVGPVETPPRGDGIAVATDPEATGTVADTLLEDNIAIGAADDGIDVDSSATTLTGNLAVHNGDLGIEAVAGVTDGGGNKASGNGNPAQCTNSDCK